jgi:hypothetical protein
VHQAAEDHVLIAERARSIAEEPEYISRTIERVRHETARHHWPDRMQLEFKRGGDSKIATSASERPEEIGLIIRACAYDIGISRDDIDREKVVQGKAVPAHEPAEPASES